MNLHEAKTAHESWRHAIEKIRLFFSEQTMVSQIFLDVGAQGSNGHFTFFVKLPHVIVGREIKIQRLSTFILDPVTQYLHDEFLNHEPFSLIATKEVVNGIFGFSMIHQFRDLLFPHFF